MFAARVVYDAVKNEKTVGILHEDRERKVWDIGTPVGVIAGIVPSTNPTSTVIYKAMIALKGGNAIVFSPTSGRKEMHTGNRAGHLQSGMPGRMPQRSHIAISVPTMEQHKP